MDYKKIYHNLMSSRQALDRKKRTSEHPDYIYYEKHHILPRCLGGKNYNSNLVLLTPKEHYIAHVLLVQFHKSNEKKKMAFALWKMCQTSKNKKTNLKGTIISANQYAYAKELFIAQGIWNKGFTKDTHPSVRKTSEKLTGKTLPKNVRDKISKKLIDRPISDSARESRKGIIPWNKNKKCGEMSQQQKDIRAQLYQKLPEEQKCKIKTHLRNILTSAKPVLQFSLSGVFIKRWVSVTAAKKIWNKR